MHITEEKGWQEVQKANTNQDEASSHLGGHVLEEFNLPLDQLCARLGAIASLRSRSALAMAGGTFSPTRHSLGVL